MSSHADESFYNITETYNPRYRKGEFNHLLLKKHRSTPSEPQKLPNIELSEALLHNFRALGEYINNLDELFKARMAVHEQQIIQIAHSEIKKIQTESQGIIKMYSDLIRAKNISSQIIDLKYQVKYYQKRACEMFQQNKQLKRKIKILQGQIDMFKLEQQTNHIALRNVSKKYLKQKMIRRNMEMGSFKRKLIRDSSDNNIKISLLSRSEIKINPEKQDHYIYQTLTPTRQDSKTSEQKGGSSLVKKKYQSRKFLQSQQFKIRVRTQPARDQLPPVKTK